jgi:ribosomal protein S27AE
VYVVFNGRPLEEADLLSAAGVEEEATLNVLGRLLGGAKKRKKKTYTKPKKQKHKHKKIKLRVLKFYKVRSRGWSRRTEGKGPQLADAPGVRCVLGSRGCCGWRSGVEAVQGACQSIKERIHTDRRARAATNAMRPAAEASKQYPSDMHSSPIPTPPPLCPTPLAPAPQVDDSGKVQRLRKQCPQCGPGTFMATHFDRVYCGKCTTT